MTKPCAQRRRAIDPSEDKVSIEATHAMRASFAGGDFAGVPNFDELVALLTGGARPERSGLGQKQ